MMSLSLIVRDPGAGYLDTHLWLPKRFVSEVQIMSALFYEARSKEVGMVRAWKEEPHHFLVPRNYLSKEALGTLPFPVYDTRFTAFPKIALKSTVVLDAQAPQFDYQRKGAAGLLAVQDGILCLRCGAGKSPVGLHAAAQLGVPVLVIVNEHALAQQWRAEIKEFLGLTGKAVGEVGAGVFDWEHDITVAVIHTLATRARNNTLPPEMARHFGVLLIDECHMLGAPFFNAAIPEFHGRRWGLSATPKRGDNFDSLIDYTIGSVVYTYLTPELRPNVYFLRLPTRIPATRVAQDATHDVTGEFHHGMAYGYLADMKERTKAIVEEVKVALSFGRQVLILTHSRRMCEVLGEAFPEGGVVHGDVKAKDRLRIIRASNPLIAIMRVGGQALNKPNLDTLFVVDPYTKANMAQQTMGRLLRSFTGKKSPSVIFVEDSQIPELVGCCGSLRRTLSRWPISKGGPIGYRMIEPGQNKKKGTGA